MFFSVTEDSKIRTEFEIFEKGFFTFGLQEIWQTGVKMGKRIEEHESDWTVVFLDQGQKVINGLKTALFYKEIHHFYLVTGFGIFGGWNS